MALHVKTGIAAPTTIPTEVGQHFLDTANNIAYISVNTLAVSDWKQTSGGGAGATSLLDLTDTPINYIGAAGKSVVIDDDELGTSFVDPIATMGLSTSYLAGCIVTANANPVLFDMSAGSGIHIDNSIPGKPVFTPIVVPERLGVSVTNIGTQTSTGLSIDISGNIIQQADRLTPTQRRSRFGVGALIHTDLATIVDIAVAFTPGFDTHAQLNDLMDALGFFLTGGNEISGVSGTLSIKKAAGTGFAKGGNGGININDPHDVNLVEQDPITFFTIDQLSVVAGVSTFLDPTSYDNAGTPTTVPSNNNATIKYVYLFATGAISILQGQEVFSNFAAAVDSSGSETIIVPEILGSGILMARIVMQKTATDTTNGALVRIIPTNAVSSAGGGGAQTTMQQSYDISVAPQITLTAGLGGVEYEDAATPIGASLLKVASSGGSTIHLDVDDERVTAQKFVDVNSGFDSSKGFISQPDTPSSYETPDQAGRFVSINAAGDGLEFSGGVLWTPADLSVESISWVDASDESTITESGGNVSLIADKTSNGNDLSQNTGSRQPETGQTLNGLNVLTFDHTTVEALVHNTFPIPASKDLSVFTVQSYTGGSGTISDSLFSMDSATSDWQTTSDNVSQYDGRMNTSGMGGATMQTWAGGPFNGPSIYNAYFNRTDSVRGAYVDGVEVTTEEVYTTGMDTPQQFRIMANRGNTGSVSGILAEMVIVEDQSLETRQLIEGYLKWKWNLAALPSGHPYEFSAPTVAVGAGGGFTNLRETPNTLGTPGQIVQVNETGDALEFKENLIVTAPDLGRWRILVDNSGNLSTELE